jgi:hypothetical protein
MDGRMSKVPVTKAAVTAGAAKSPWRALPAERRTAILERLFRERKEARALYVQRLVQRGGGFRAATLLGWPVEKLAREVVRMNAPTVEDEVDLLQALYVDLEPAIQSDFLDAAGVKHAKGAIEESLQPPYADAAAVARAAATVRERHGADGEHYLRTIARYNGAGWPGIEGIVDALPASA